MRWRRRLPPITRHEFSARLRRKLLRVTAPPDQLPDPPRNIRVLTRYWRLGMLIYLPLIPVLYVVLGLFFQLEQTGLMLSGAEASGVVVEKRAEQRGEKTARFSVVYEFVVEGVNFRAEQNVAPSEYATLKRGDHCRVTFRQDNPYVNRVGAVTLGRVLFSEEMSLLAFLLLVVVGVLGIQTGVEHRRCALESDLLRRGIAVSGLITRKSWFHPISKAPPTAYYEFATREGVRVTGSYSLPWDVWERLDVGDVVAILYLQWLPSRNALLLGCLRVELVR